MTEPDDVAGVSWICGVFDAGRDMPEIFEIYSGRYVRFNGAACDDTEICSPWYLGAVPTHHHRHQEGIIIFQGYSLPCHY